MKSTLLGNFFIAQPLLHCCVGSQKKRIYLASESKRKNEMVVHKQFMLMLHNLVHKQIMLMLHNLVHKQIMLMLHNLVHTEIMLMLH